MSDDKEGLEKEDLFPVQFRHEQVVKFVRGLVEGSIILTTPSKSNLELYDFALRTQNEILNAINKYVSGKLRGQELENLEQELFSKYAALKVCGVLEEKVTQTQLEKDIHGLHSRLDSISTLLLDLVTILKGIGKE